MFRRIVLRRQVKIAVLIGVVAVGLSMSSVANPKSSTPMDLVLQDEEGNTLLFANLTAQKPVLLYFWATWCKPCRKIQPMVSTFAQKYQDRIKVLGINAGGLDSKEVVKKYRTRYKITYPLLLDHKNKAVSDFGVVAIPAFILLDGGGEIRFRGDKPPKHPDEFLTQ